MPSTLLGDNLTITFVTGFNVIDAISKDAIKFFYHCAYATRLHTNPSSMRDV